MRRHFTVALVILAAISAWAQSQESREVALYASVATAGTNPVEVNDWLLTKPTFGSFIAGASVAPQSGSAPVPALNPGLCSAFGFRECTSHGSWFDAAAEKGVCGFFTASDNAAANPSLLKDSPEASGCGGFATPNLEPLLALADASELVDKERAGSTTSSIQPMIRMPSESPPAKVQWRPLIKESLYFLAIMNSFRIATEPSTRAGMKNSVVGGYFKALGAMHGWSDGDGYYENYLGHPIEGAIADYMWIHNDPRYRTVEFGRSRDYWMSRLRAYAFSWAFSEQFEIGLLSEASIGQIQRYCCAFGFVDHVITPTGGMVWLVGGDILDKYVVRRIEDHTRNVAVRAIVRGIFNPPLSFANVLAGEAPWHRDNRPGIHAYEGKAYVRPVSQAPTFVDTSQTPRFELTGAVPSILQQGQFACYGGGGVAGFRLSEQWQWSAEVSGCTMGNSMPENWSGNSLTFNTGPQWIRHTESLWTPHAHLRFGGQKVVVQYSDPVLKKKVLDALPPGTKPSSVYYDYVSQYESTGVSLSMGGGVDYGLNRAMAVRVANFDYIHSWLGQVGLTDFDNGYRFSAGLVLRVGKW